MRTKGFDYYYYIYIFVLLSANQLPFRKKYHKYISFHLFFIFIKNRQKSAFSASSNVRGVNHRWCVLCSQREAQTYAWLLFSDFEALSKALQLYKLLLIMHVSCFCVMMWESPAIINLSRWPIMYPNEQVRRWISDLAVCACVCNAGFRHLVSCTGWHSDC